MALIRISYPTTRSIRTGLELRSNTLVPLLCLDLRINFGLQLEHICVSRIILSPSQRMQMPAHTTLNKTSGGNELQQSDKNSTRVGGSDDSDASSSGATTAVGQQVPRVGYDTWTADAAKKKCTRRELTLKHILKK